MYKVLSHVFSLGKIVDENENINDANFPIYSIHVHVLTLDRQL